MNRLSILRLFVLLCYLKYTYSAQIFRLDEKHPKYKSEIEVCGNIRDVIKRNSARFLKILVRNTNSDILFSNDDARRMTARAKSKLDVLASRVQARWSGKKVEVLKAWTDVVTPNSISLHYEGKFLSFNNDLVLYGKWKLHATALFSARNIDLLYQNWFSGYHVAQNLLEPFLHL